MTTAPQTDGIGKRINTVLAKVPVDLLCVSLVASAVFVTVLRTGSEYSWLRGVAGLVFVLILPGYALVSATFPGRPTGSVVTATTANAYSPGTTERLALSFVFSLTLLPLLAVGHGLFGITFEPVAVAGSVTFVVILFSVLATLRRFTRPLNERYRPPSISRQLHSFRRWVSAGGTADTVLSVALAVSIVLAVGTLAIGLTEPTQGGSYTSVSLVSEEEDGTAVASNYPTNFTAGEGQNLTVQVENNYETTQRYTTVVELQRVSGQGSSSLDVLDREEIQTESRKVSPNETWSYAHEIEPTMAGSELRLIYYVYQGDAPETPSEDTAEASTQLWVSVQE